MSRTNITPLLLRRYLSTSRPSRLPLPIGPAPPRLPEKEQREFEELQRASTGAFSTPRSQVNQASQKAQVNQSPQGQTEESSTSEQLNARIQAKGDGEELHPDVRRGATPEFEGDRNPKTGEIGGPKNDPLRWGGKADWSYNGRVTDF